MTTNELCQGALSGASPGTKEIVSMCPKNVLLDVTCIGDSSRRYFNPLTGRYSFEISQETANMVMNESKRRSMSSDEFVEYCVKCFFDPSALTKT